jgi:hypothetical protein
VKKTAAEALIELVEAESQHNQTLSGTDWRALTEESARRAERRAQAWRDVWALVAELKSAQTDHHEEARIASLRKRNREQQRHILELQAGHARKNADISHLRQLLRSTSHAQLRRLISDDAWAISFQSLGQYRTALLKKLNEAETA